MSDINGETKKTQMNDEKWVVVVDDSNCTVGMGGEGYMWQVANDDGWNYRMKNGYKGNPNFTTGPYSKSIFRDATQEEIKNWKENKQRAVVPLNNKPKLYEGYGRCPFGF